MEAPDSSDPPGPRGLPFLGGRANFLRFLYDPIAFMRRLRASYGDVVSLARGDPGYVFVFGAEHNQAILSKPHVFRNLDVSNIPLRIAPGSPLSRLFNGLIQMNGPEHDSLRRRLAPAVGRSHAKAHATTIAHAAQVQLESWKPGKVVDLAREMTEVALKVAVPVLLGLEAGAGGHRMGLLLGAWLKAVFSPVSVALPLDWPGLPYGRLQQLSSALEVEMKTVISRKEMSKLEESDVLARIIQSYSGASEKVTDDELVGHATFLFVAGHATTASALTWTLFLLACHPQIMSDVGDECSGAAGDPAASASDIDDRPLLDAVVRESLRLLPPVIWWIRVGAEPFEIGARRFPAGTKVITSAFMTHRDSASFPEPDVFDPGRWRSIRPGPYEYCPFSAGPRMCLGSSLAMLEIKVVVSAILQRFGLALIPRTSVDYRGPMLLAPRGRVPVLLTDPHRSPAGAGVHLNGRIPALVGLRA
jgi:cytochrome P450